MADDKRVQALLLWMASYALAEEFDYNMTEENYEKLSKIFFEAYGYDEDKASEQLERDLRKVIQDTLASLT